MEPENPTPQPPSHSEAAGAESKTYTQAELDAAVRAAKDAAAAEVRRAFEGKQPKAKQTNEPKPAASPAADGPTLREQWADLMEDYGDSLTKEQRRLARDMFLQVKPEDPGAWLKGFVGAFGQKQPEKPTTETPTPKPHVQAPPPAVNVPVERDDRVMEWNEDQVNAYIRAKAPVPSNPYHPKNRAVWKEIRRRVEAELAETRVVTSRGK